MKGLEQQRARAAYWFIGPWLLGFILFTLYPLLFSFYASFCKWENAQLHWIGLENYQRIFGEQDFWLIGLRTIFFGLLNTPIVLVFALLLALLINQKVRGVKFFRTLYFLPVVAASDVISTTAGSLLFSRVIIFNLDLTRFGIQLPEQTAGVISGLMMLIALGLWRTGIQMLIFLMGLNSVPQDFYEAAVMDGATEWQKFWWVTIPMISPLLLLNVILTIVESFNGLATTMQIMNRGETTYFIWDYVYYLTNRRFDYSGALVVVWMFILATLALIGIIFKIANRKER